MNVKIKRLYNNNAIETGAILSVNFSVPTNLQQKNAVENQLIEFAFSSLYPGKGLSIFREIYIDTPSIAVFKNINNLPEDIATI